MGKIISNLIKYSKTFLKIVKVQNKNLEQKKNIDDFLLNITEKWNQSMCYFSKIGFYYFY